MNRWSMVAIALSAVLLCAGPETLEAAGLIQVNTLSDSVAVDGSCSLREAIYAAVTEDFSWSQDHGCGVDIFGNMTIWLMQKGSYPASSTFEITGSSKNITVEPYLSDTYADEVYLDAGSQRLLMHIHGNTGDVTFNRITFNAGKNNATADHSGGAFLIDQADVNFNMCAIKNSIAGRGGGIFAQGATVTVNESSFTGNYASSLAATGTHAGGAIYLHASLALVRNSTFSANYARQYGGAIAVGAASRVELRHATITENTVGVGVSAADGGGLALLGDSATPGDAYLSHSIVADNSDLASGGFVNKDCFSSTSETANSYGHNLVGDAQACGIIPLIPGDHFGSPGSYVSAQLASLETDARGTDMHAPGAGSLALEGGAATTGVAFSQCHPSDQRGEARPVDGDGDMIASCDIGAVELTAIFADGFESGNTSRWSAAEH